jgi:hypothetical protein
LPPPYKPLYLNDLNGLDYIHDETTTNTSIEDPTATPILTKNTQAKI